MSTTKNHFTGKYLIILLTATVILAILATFKMVNSGKFQSVPIDTELNKIETQSTDTEVDSIEQDLNNTEFDNLDKELQDIDTEMQVSL